MSIDRWIDKEDVVHIYNGILLSHKKEKNWVICSDVDEPRVCHTEWSKSEREKQISYINAYIWNLEKWYWWTYLQGRKRDTDIENILVDTVEEGEGGTKWESSIDIYTLPCVKQIASGKLLYGTRSSARCSVMTYRGGMGGWEGGSRWRGYMYKYSWFTSLYSRN